MTKKNLKNPNKQEYAQVLVVKCRKLKSEKCHLCPPPPETLISSHIQKRCIDLFWSVSAVQLYSVNFHRVVRLLKTEEMFRTPWVPYLRALICILSELLMLLKPVCVLYFRFWIRTSIMQPYWIGKAIWISWSLAINQGYPECHLNTTLRSVIWLGF